MRITATIQDDMMTEIMNLTSARTKTEAVNNALAEWIRIKRIQKIKELRGKIPMADVSDELCEREIREIEELNGRCND